jgi:hexosaminidase
MTAAIIPWPAAVETKRGAFELGVRTSIVADKTLLRQARLLQNALVAPTDYHLPIVGRSAGHRIELRLARRLARLGPEGYELDVSVRRIAIRASAAAGAFCAIQTLLQMMPPEILRRAPVGNVRWRVPCIAIEDAPRFSWRGLLIDVARHFLPKEFIFKMLDLMALYKLNVLQLHLTDDHGWRIEIKRYPRLTEIGARSDYSAIERPYEATRSRSQRPGGFYTQDDIREMVRYAADRCITVVPEIEMPGHAGAAILAYPELGKDRVFNVEDSTIRMLKNVLDEVLELFPSKFIHIGGDEVSKLPWKSDPRARQRMRAAGLQNEEELQSWFIKQFDSYLTAKGRRLVGWDEILEGGLAPGATVMSWRGVAGGVAAAKAGHDVVMAPTDKTYFDAYQSRLQALEPQALAKCLPLDEVYTFEPIAPALSADEGKRVLGAQASLWGEYISQPKHAEYMGFPRLLAFAETVWSTPRSRDWDSFISRLYFQFKKLDALDVNYRPYRPDPAPLACGVPGAAGARWVVREWDISASIKNAGHYKAVFVDAPDAGWLEVQWIELIENGRPIQKIERAQGRPGENGDKVFALTVMPTPGAAYTLRARLRARRGKEASAHIYVLPAPTVR